MSYCPVQEKSLEKNTLGYASSCNRAAIFENFKLWHKFLKGFDCLKYSELYADPPFSPEIYFA